MRKQFCLPKDRKNVYRNVYSLGRVTLRILASQLAKCTRFIIIYSKYYKSINNQFVFSFNLTTYLSIINRYLDLFNLILIKNFNYLLLKRSTTINSYSSRKSILIYNILLDKISNYFCSYSIERLSFRLPRKLISTNDQPSIPFSI